MPTPDRQPEDRFSRQTLLPQIGAEGQRRLAEGRATLIGCGALGTVIADTLVRAGVGFLRIVDRDYVELNNLQRQVLFDEQDAAAGLPKSAAAAAKLTKINSAATIEPVIADAHGDTIESFVFDAQVILDGTDNFETRFLINDVAVKLGIPWVYGACVGTTGMVMPIVPGTTPCLRCIWDQPPPPGVNPTCDTAGVLAPVVHLVAALQCVEAMKVLMGRRDELIHRLVQIDGWSGRFDAFEMQGAAAGEPCACCLQRRFDYLDARGARTANLCGRNAVQIAAGGDGAADLEGVARRVQPVAKSPVQLNRYLLRFSVDAFEVTLFRDGRAIIKGTAIPEEARAVYAKYVGA